MFKILGSLCIVLGGLCIIYLVHEFYVSEPIPPWQAVFVFFGVMYAAGGLLYIGAELMAINTFRISKENLLRIFGTKVH